MNENRPLPKFWTEDDREEAVKATVNGSYVFLGAVALGILQGMRRDNPNRVIAIVCGPITNGGTLSGHEVMKNMARFDGAIRSLEELGFLVFNQLPFEEYLFTIRRNRPAEDPNVLLEEFYRLLFESGIINITYFLTGWQNSHGARWENKLAKSLEMPRIENVV